MPREMQGWKAQGQDRVLDRKTIFDYLDGGAEAYLTYGFRRLFSRRFVRAGEAAITVDAFDMGSSKDAFGIFSFERESGDVGVGQDSEYAAGLLRFWKWRYFVAVTAERETTSSRSAVMSLGKAIAANIRTIGKRPDIVDFLPSNGLVPNSVRYFHTHSALNHHYFLAHENILNLDRRTDAVLARYAPGGGKKCALLIARYPSAAAAASALRKFKEAYMPEARKTGIARLENGTWSAATAKGSVLVAVFDAPSESRARSLVGAATGRLAGRSQ